MDVHLIIFTERTLQGVTVKIHTKNLHLVKQKIDQAFV